MNQDVLTEKRAFSIAEAAKYACVSRGIVDNWLNKGLLPYEELPRYGNGSNRFRRIRRHNLDNFLNDKYQNKAKQSKTVKSKDHFLLPKNSH
jgi:hypothetical protein